LVIPGIEELNHQGFTFTAAEIEQTKGLIFNRIEVPIMAGNQTKGAD